MSDIEDQEGDGRRRYKISKDRAGNRFVRTAKKKITVPKNITDAGFLKWLIKYLKPKRKKREQTTKPKTKSLHPFATTDHLELSSTQAADEGVRNYVNIERERAGREKLDAPVGPGLPATIDQEAQEKRQAEREAKRAARAERERALTDAKEAAEHKAAVHEKNLRETAANNAFRDLHESYTIIQLRALINGTIASPDERKEARVMLKLPLAKWLLDHEEPNVTARYNEYKANELQQLIGAGKTPRGMTTDDINKVMNPYRPHYLGTIARNEWELLTPATHTGKSAWIMNTDPNTKGGTHWVAFLMDLDRHTIEYYNSFGDDIPADILTLLKTFIENNNPTKQYLKLKVNRVVDQAATSANCGWFCCQFIIDRFRGRPWQEVTKFDDHIRGEEAVNKFKAQHGGAYSVLL